MSISAQTEMSIQYQRMGTGGGCAPSSVECEAEGNSQVTNELNVRNRQLLLLQRKYQYLPYQPTNLLSLENLQKHAKVS